MIKEKILYPESLIADIVIVFARCGILLLLYSYIFAFKGSVINETTFQVAGWSMFFYFAFMNLRIRSLTTSIMQDIKSGNIEVLFSKPVQYLLYRYWWQIGEGLYSFLVTTIGGTVLMILFVGIPNSVTTIFFLVTFCFTFIFSILLSLLIYSVIGLFAFWIEDVKPLYWIIDKMIMILGGSYLPVALFPKFMYLFAVYSPFGASQFITHTVYESWKTNAYMMMGIQFGWVVIFGVIVSFMFGFAYKKVSVNGG